MKRTQQHCFEEQLLRVHLEDNRPCQVCLSIIAAVTLPNLSEKDTCVCGFRWAETESFESLLQMLSEDLVINNNSVVKGWSFLFYFLFNLTFEKNVTLSLISVPPICEYVIRMRVGVGLDISIFIKSQKLLRTYILLHFYFLILVDSVAVQQI